MGVITDLSEKFFQGQLDPALHHPFSPLMAIEELGPNLAFVSSFANVTALATPEGLVLFDTGSFLLAPMVHGLVRSYSKQPLHTAVYTHGHIDHCFGVELYEAESLGPVRVVAHEAVPARFARYRLTGGYNACINARQFKVQVAWPTRYREPDLTFATELALDIGGERIELHHARGETDDHTWIWLPARKVVLTGDLFIWATPNAGNPQKVQRYPLEWATALRKMAALGPEILCPGHGPPIVGAARVRQALEDTAALLEHLVTETLAMMNTGAPLDEILHTVRAPAHLLERPYLRPIYDEPEFIVRNVWRQYGGWHDGNPARLKPAPESQIARELASLAGGAAVLADRGAALADAGDFRLACHLLELAARAAPDDPRIRDLRSDVYARRAKRETSLMAQGIFTAASERR